jgi:hypothetical protein
MMFIGVIVIAPCQQPRARSSEAPVHLQHRKRGEAMRT